MLVAMATVAVSVAGVGTAVSLGSDESSDPKAPVVDQQPGVVDAGPNVWAANDCTVLREVYGEAAQAYGC